MRGTLGIAIVAVCATATLAACDGRMPVKPRSGGNPYEVVVMADNDTARNAVAEALQQPVKGLPQAEKAFDLTLTKGSTLNQATRYARCIVVVSTGKDEMPATSIKYERDVYARPQLLVRVSSATAGRLCADMMSVRSHLARLINRFETADAVAQLRKRHNAEAAKAVSEVTGCTLLVPADMTYSKRGRDFIWLTDNAAKGLQSLCIYTYPGTDTRAATVTERRDSVMKANLPGERTGTFMRTDTGSRLYRRTFRKGGRQVTEVRGLWEMEGDAMGGPFVCHAVADSARGRTVVAEAFVYAPEGPKRNLTRQLEAALLTLRLTK